MSASLSRRDGRSMPWRPMVAVALGCAVLVASAVGASTASASPLPDGTRLDVVVGADGDGWTSGRVDVSDLIPGAPATTAVLVVGQKLSPRADIEMYLTDFAQRENGCVRAEARMEPGCGQDETGELGNQLTITVREARMEGDVCVTSPGDRVLAGLDHRPIADVAGSVWQTVEVATGERLCLSLAFDLPDRPDNNIVMTDSVTFALNVGARQLPASDEAAVLGTKISSTGPGETAVQGRRYEALPRTGGDFGVLGAIGAVLLAAGGTAIWRAKKPREATKGLKP